MEGVNVPQRFRVGGQLNCEMWALTRYLLIHIIISITKLISVANPLMEWGMYT